MKTKTLAVGILSAAVLATATSATALDWQPKEAGTWMVRLRMIDMKPQESGDVLTQATSADSGWDVKLTEDYVPEIDLTYFFTDNFAVEVIAGTTKHKARVYNGTTMVDAGDVKLLPPVVTAQWHFNPKGKVSPYVGAGINYTFFYDVNDGSLSNVSYEDGFGWALQAGVDVATTGPWFVNFDVKKVWLDTDLKADATGVGLVPVKSDVDIDPWVFGVGLGRKF